MLMDRLAWLAPIGLLCFTGCALNPKGELPGEENDSAELPEPADPGEDLSPDVPAIGDPDDMIGGDDVDDGADDDVPLGPSDGLEPEPAPTPDNSADAGALAASDGDAGQPAELSADAGQPAELNADAGQLTDGGTTDSGQP